jgi:hypothetical protein
MSDPARMGIGIPTGSTTKPRARHCPGANLRVTRADYLAMRQEGQVFTTDPQDIRAEGLSDARTLCHDDVAVIRIAAGKEDGREDGRTIFATYDSALCASCATMERNNRSDLATRAAARPK